MASLDVKERILELKEEKQAAILAHNYVIPDIQDVADIVADSLVLARKGVELPNSILLIAGVDFMAESVKILNPEKKVIHINPGSQCPMAHMAEADDFRDFRKLHPGVPSVAYVNTTAELKTLVDYCVTSANAVQIVKAIDGDKVIFLPDLNLGNYVQSQVPDKELILWPGHCYVHSQIKKEVVQKVKREHPEAELLAHPECRGEVLELADKVASTEGMVKYAQASNAKEFIITTEEGLVYRMRKMMPDKVFHKIPEAICSNMKKMTLENLLNSLETLEPEVTLPEDVIEKARLPLERMVNILE
jgi:quinolinate synthase